MTVHDLIRPIKCKVCEYSTAYSHRFKKHQCRHEYAKIGKNCPYCNHCNSVNDVYKRSHLTHIHIKEVQDRILENCSYCEYKGSPPNRSMHIMTAHDKIMSSCSFCYFKGSPKNKVMHIMTYHDRIRPFKCHSCEYSAAYHTTLKNHTATIHNGQKLRFKMHDCPYCNYKSSPYYINKHIRAVHDQIKQLQEQILKCCPYCTYKGNSSDRNKHIKYVHDRIRFFQCKFCAYSTTMPTKLIIHNASKHKRENLQSHY
jgi:KRAB domain-containing zinc finger protein